MNFHFDLLKATQVNLREDLVLNLLEVLFFELDLVRNRNDLLFKLVDLVFVYWDVLDLVPHQASLTQNLLLLT